MAFYEIECTGKANMKYDNFVVDSISGARLIDSPWSLFIYYNATLQAWKEIEQISFHLDSSLQLWQTCKRFVNN